MDENEIPHTVSVERVTLAPGNARPNDGTDQNNDIPGANHRTNEKESDENGIQASREFTVHRIVRHVGTGRRTKYVI